MRKSKSKKILINGASYRYSIKGYSREEKKTPISFSFIAEKDGEKGILNCFCSIKKIEDADSKTWMLFDQSDFFGELVKEAIVKAIDGGWDCCSYRYLVLRMDI